jgi:hypothetical protein
MPCAINCANSSGEPSSGSKPDPASLPTTSSDLSAARAAAESFSITAGGVPAGAIRPNQTVQSKLGSKTSAMVGMFGAMRGRFLETTGFNVRHDRRGHHQRHRQAARDQVGDLRRTPLVGHVNKLDVRTRTDQFHGEMPDRPRPDRSVGEVTRL